MGKTLQRVFVLTLLLVSLLLQLFQPGSVHAAGSKLSARDVAATVTSVEPANTPTSIETDKATTLPSDEETKPAATKAPVEIATLIQSSETPQAPASDQPTVIETPVITNTISPSETPQSPTPVEPTETEMPAITDTVSPSETLQLPTLAWPTETSAPVWTNTTNSTATASSIPSNTPNDDNRVNPTDTPDLSPGNPTDIPTPIPTPIQPALPLVQAVAQISGKTDIKIVNNTGKLEPLASQRASNIVATNGPMWCSSVTQGCAQAASVSELVTLLNTNGLSGDGTVYFTETYNAPDAIFDKNDLKNLGILTIQGGWDGVVGHQNQASGKTTFTSQLAVINWDKKVKINNVDAQQGALVDTSGSVKIADSSFSNQSGVGLLVDSSGNVTVSSSTLSNSDVGAQINAKGKILVQNSSIKNNTTGISVSSNQDDSTMDNVAFCQNETDMDTMSGDPPTVKNSPPNPCTGPRQIKATSTPSVLFDFLAQHEGEFTLSCVGQNGFLVTLPNSDRVQIFCPVTGKARIGRLDNTMLPADLDSGYRYISAFSIEIIQNTISIPVVREGGYIKASFVIPSRKPDARYGIMFWNAQQGHWKFLNEYALGKDGAAQSFALYPNSSDDLRKIISGVYFRNNTKPVRDEVTVNFPGIFVLVEY